MKTKAFFIVIAFIGFFIGTINAQSPSFGRDIHMIPDEWSVDIGINSTIPTSSIIFEKQREGKEGVINETLSNEYDVARIPGAYVELSRRLQTLRPIFVGASFRYQNLFNRNSKRVSDAFELDGNDHYINWCFKNNAHLYDFSLFAEYPLWYRDNFSLFARGDIGVSRFSNVINAEWRRTDWAPDDFETVNLRRFGDTVFSFDMGVGARWQFSEGAALRGHIGYQFQTATNFNRLSHIAAYDSTLEFNGELPNNNDFNLIEPEVMTDRSNRFSYEHLNAQVGISISLDRGFIAEKPILYLYPTDTTDVHVELVLHDQEFIFTYPAYPKNGWSVRAYPDGKIHDYETERNYYSLFWETEGAPIAENLEEGYVIKGSKTREFLEYKLDKLGLNFKEANEFLIYWLPQMENNEYNAVYFAFEEYEASSELHITPQPDTVIRIMMLWEGMEEKIELVPQNLTEAPERIGFTAVEWGGIQGEFFKKDEHLPL